MRAGFPRELSRSSLEHRSRLLACVVTLGSEKYRVKRSIRKGETTAERGCVASFTVVRVIHQGIELDLLRPQR